MEPAERIGRGLFFSLRERIVDLKTRETSEITITRNEFANAVFKAQRGNVSIVDQITRCVRIPDDLQTEVRVPLCLRQENKRG